MTNPPRTMGSTDNVSSQLNVKGQSGPSPNECCFNENVCVISKKYYFRNQDTG